MTHEVLTWASTVCGMPVRSFIDSVMLTRCPLDDGSDFGSRDVYEDIAGRLRPWLAGVPGAPGKGEGD
jgi:hypothetical protein